MKYRSPEIGCYNDRIALTFGGHLGSAAAYVPVKFQNDWKSLNPNIAISRLHEILRQASYLWGIVTTEFPPQRASNAENVSIWWRHHGSMWYFYGLVWLQLLLLLHKAQLSYLSPQNNSTIGKSLGYIIKFCRFHTSVISQHSFLYQYKHAYIDSMLYKSKRVGAWNVMSTSAIFLSLTGQWETNKGTRQK